MLKSTAGLPALGSPSGRQTAIYQGESLPGVLGAVPWSCAMASQVGKKGRSHLAAHQYLAASANGMARPRSAAYTTVDRAGRLKAQGARDAVSTASAIAAMFSTRSRS